MQIHILFSIKKWAFLLRTIRKKNP
uniref:Uncharacterized protein n=1 Tax=Rhizophora mucronata TaxID=61149 RepID=A0A2P2NV29_RHIMU